MREFRENLKVFFYVIAGLMLTAISAAAIFFVMVWSFRFAFALLGV